MPMGSFVLADIQYLVTGAWRQLSEKHQTRGKYGMELRMDWVPELCAKYKLKLVGE